MGTETSLVVKHTDLLEELSAVGAHQHHDAISVDYANVAWTATRGIAKEEFYCAGGRLETDGRRDAWSDMPGMCARAVVGTDS